VSGFEALVAALRTDEDNLLSKLSDGDNEYFKAGVRAALSLIRATVNRFEAAEPEPMVWPDAWEIYSRCTRCGLQDPPMLATTNGGLMCHPACPPIDDTGEDDTTGGAL
jgi:hypothetical protein